MQKNDTMRKITLLLLLILLMAFTGDRPTLVPGLGVVQLNYIHPGNHELTWFTLIGGKKEMAKVRETFSFCNGQLLVVTDVVMSKPSAPWVDSTWVDSITMRPIRHVSTNQQRDMELNFGNVVSGYYMDKKKEQRTTISDTVNAAYFDSNLYPHLVRWLNLQNGMHCDLAIYDYNPKSGKGIMQVHVTDVKSGTFATQQEGNREVWIVKVTDDISPKMSTVHYIDKVTRQLWQQDVLYKKKRVITMQRMEK